MSPEEQLDLMRREWDERAKENARYYVNTEKQDWTDEEFYQSGELTVAQEILTDMTNICQGKDPKQMTILEIGCGAGRVTRALSKVFGKVYAVDISAEMVAQAKAALHPRSSMWDRLLRALGFHTGQGVRIFRNNGRDLSVLPAGLEVDFAFSTIVFQHIPSKEVIVSYVREVHRLLRPGGLFKFQVQGDTRTESLPGDTWHGVPFSDEDAVEMANACGFEPRHRHGAGQQYFWLWFFKR